MLFASAGCGDVIIFKVDNCITHPFGLSNQRVHVFSSWCLFIVQKPLSFSGIRSAESYALVECTRGLTSLDSTIARGQRDSTCCKEATLLSLLGVTKIISVRTLCTGGSSSNQQVLHYAVISCFRML